MVLAPGKDLEGRVASVRVVEGKRIYALDGQEYREREPLGNTRNSHTFVVESPEGVEVLKVLNYRRFPGQSVDEKRKAIELFEREMDVLARLDHPQIPKIKNYFTTNLAGETAFYFTQEYFSGSTVEKLIAEQGKLALEQALQITRSLLEPLDYCHQRNIYHRDIKPANIIWDGNQTKLVDFGAVMEGKVSTIGGSTMIGTLGYAAPEQLWGKASAASDIYSLGATLLHMLTGLHPETMHDHQANDFNERFRLQFSTHIQSLEAWTQNILVRCLDVDERKRYQAVPELRNALEQRLEKTALVPSPPTEVMYQPTKREILVELKDTLAEFGKDFGKCSLEITAVLVSFPYYFPSFIRFLKQPDHAENRETRIGENLGGVVGAILGLSGLGAQSYFYYHNPSFLLIFSGTNLASGLFETGRATYHAARQRAIEKNKKKLLIP